jgi:hypothetical protein
MRLKFFTPKTLFKDKREKVPFCWFTFVYVRPGQLKYPINICHFCAILICNYCLCLYLGESND